MRFNRGESGLSAPPQNRVFHPLPYGWPTHGLDCEPMLLVITITVFLKSTKVNLWPSVRRLPSSTCSSTLNIGVGLSTSSSSSTEYGF
jgi:hypothetical protein